MPLSRALANVVLTTAPVMVLAALGWSQIARADAVLTERLYWFPVRHHSPRHSSQSVRQATAH